MSKGRDLSMLRHLHEVRGAMRMRAEFRVAEAERRLDATKTAVGMADDALGAAEADWRAAVGSPEWLSRLGVLVIEADRRAIAEREECRAAERRRDDRLFERRKADASERIAAQALTSARRADAVRREERRLVDRPVVSARDQKR